MLELEARSFCEAIGAIQRIRAIISRGEEDKNSAYYKTKVVVDAPRQIISEEFTKLSVTLEKLGARITLKAAQRFIDNLNDAPYFKPRSALASSSVFLATTTSEPTPAPPAVPGRAPSDKPVTTAGFVAPPPTKADTAATVPVFPANTPYANARVGLIALGYGPAPVPDAGKCDSTSDSTCFPERMACARSDGIKCDFLWRRGEQVIKVRTDAIPPTVSAVECEVNCK